MFYFSSISSYIYKNRSPHENPQSICKQLHSTYEKKIPLEDNSYLHTVFHKLDFTIDLSFLQKDKKKKKKRKEEKTVWQLLYTGCEYS